MIYLVTGPLGTGKSYYGVRKAVEGMRTGKLVATNFDLEPDWIDQVVRHGHLFKNTAKLDERSERFQRRYVRIESMADLRQLRVRPEAPWASEIEPGRWRVKERQLVVVLDEAYDWLNARSWGKEGREDLLKFFAMARKRGMVVYLIAHRMQNLDVQVRELFEDRIALKNLKTSARLLGIQVIPFNYFIAGWRSHAYGDEVVRTERYRLGWEKRLYDTMDTVSFTEGEDTEGPGLFLPRDDERDAWTADAGDAAPAVATASPPAEPPARTGGQGDPGEVPHVPDPAL